MNRLLGQGMAWIKETTFKINVVIDILNAFTHKVPDFVAP
jgi:hypothetical protein